MTQKHTQKRPLDRSVLVDPDHRMTTPPPTDYRLSKQLVVGGVTIEKGTLLSALRKRGGDWTNRGWTDRLIEDGSLVPLRATPDP